jgi:polysaccharide chain length determinant protein (PEP-CTERM system associated)
MPEDPELENSEQPDLGHYLDIARRRYLHFLIPMLIGFLGVWGASWLIKARYKSTTEILVEQPSMPKNYVLPNVSEDLEDQLNNISEQIMSRTRLLEIIDRFNLYASKGKAMSPDAKVAEMKKYIDVQLVHDDRTGGGITSFSISFSAASPQVAQEITRELSTAVISQNLQARQKESEDTTKFLDQQLEAARQALADQEAKVQRYEAAHQGALPSQQPANLAILTGLQQQLQNEQDALNTAVSQRAYFQTLIEQYRAMRGPTKTADGSTVDVAALDDALEKDRAQLADLTSRYTDSYPDVKALKSEIERTEKERDRALAAAKAARSKGSTEGSPDAATDPLNSPVMQLQGQLQANQVEISNREQGIARLKTQINDYQSRLGAEPASEEQLAELTRGYDQSKANYDELLKKRDDSQMATSLEERQQGERFSVLDPPSLPTKPDFPNRLNFCAMGIGAGLGLGILVVLGFEMVDDRLYREKEIKHLLPVAIFAEIPDITNPLDLRRSKRKAYLGFATAALVVFVILASSAISYLHS